MLDTTRDYDKLSLLDPFVMVAKLHAEAAVDDEEHLVLVIVMVEYELAVELDELDVLSVEFGSDAGFVVVGDLRKFIGDVDFGHGILAGWRIPQFQWMKFLARKSQENWLATDSRCRPRLDEAEPCHYASHKQT